MYTSKSGKNYSNPAFGRMMDQAEQEDAKKSMPGKPVAKPASGPDLKIVIIPNAGDGSFKSKSSDGEQDHPDIESLIEHLKTKLGSGEEQPSDDESQDSDQDDADPSILNSVQSLMK